MINFKINQKNGELIVCTETGYISAEPYGEGVSIMLYDKKNIDGIT